MRTAIPEKILKISAWFIQAVERGVNFPACQC
jgi:hypothetical protein